MPRWPAPHIGGHPLDAQGLHCTLHTAWADRPVHVSCLESSISNTDVSWLTPYEESHGSTLFLPNYISVELSFFVCLFVFGLGEVIVFLK